MGLTYVLPSVMKKGKSKDHDIKRTKFIDYYDGMVPRKIEKILIFEVSRRTTIEVCLTECYEGQKMDHDTK